MTFNTREQCLEADSTDPLARYRDAFVLPPETIYLDGNSLGALPRAVEDCLSDTVTEQWGRDLIRSWNDHDWIGLASRLGEKIAPLIGAEPGQVIVADSVSVNLFKLLAAALTLRPGRRVILSSEDNVPTDLYIAEGMTELLGKERCELLMVDRSRLIEAIDDNTAVVMLTHV
ncbi:MAG: kynureninase, partial [Gammaproteobacteria bacterium]|nr:kynureninase [Gammaproteobacteria bacterium]